MKKNEMSLKGITSMEEYLEALHIRRMKERFNLDVPTLKELEENKKREGAISKEKEK